MCLCKNLTPSDPKFSVTSRHVMSSAVVQTGRERVYAKMKKNAIHIQKYSYSEKSHKIRICDQMKGVAMKI